MASVIVNLLPLIIGAAILPLWIIVTLLLLQSERGVLKTSAFAAGAIAVRLVQGLLFGYVFERAAEYEDQDDPQFIQSTLLVLVSIIMLIVTIKTWLNEGDPDAPPPRWMTAVANVSPMTALAKGALLMAVGIKPWVFTLSAIAVICEAQITALASVLSYIVFVLAAHIPVLAPLALRIIAPSHAARALTHTQQWLERNNRMITIATSLCFGLWFAWKGTAGLLTAPPR